MRSGVIHDFPIERCRIAINQHSLLLNNMADTSESRKSNNSTEGTRMKHSIEGVPLAEQFNGLPITHLCPKLLDKCRLDLSND